MLHSMDHPDRYLVISHKNLLWVGPLSESDVTAHSRSRESSQHKHVGRWGPVVLPTLHLNPEPAAGKQPKRDRRRCGEQ